MNPEETNPDFDASVREVMQKLPLPVRKYLALGKYQTVVRQIMQMYKLHIDEAGELESQLLLLLMGINSPIQFAQALQGKTRLPPDTIHGIVGEVNQQIFVPLHEQMRNATPAAEQVGVNAAPTKPEAGGAAASEVVATQRPVATQGAYAPAPEAVPAPMSSPAPSIVLPPTSAADAEPQEDSAPLPPRRVLPGAPGLRNLIVHPPLPTRGAPPPENLPGTVPEFIDLHPPVAAAPESEAPVLPPIPPRSAPPQSAPVAPVPPYTVDPYREPPE